MGLIGKAGLDTEQSLLRMRAELGLTEDQMKTLREEALRVGSTLPLNTADIVNAQRAYGKLGATFGEIIRDVPAIAGAAVSTGLQPEQVARYARIVQNVFGGDPQENLDIMVRLASRSQGDFLAFGEALQFSGQSAADAGLDFKTYIATLGGLAGSGRSVESVSQGLAGIWAKLAKAEEGIGPGGKVVQKAFEGVGISMADVNATMDGTADGFVRLLELINDAGLSPTQRTALLSTLAGDTYASAVSSAVQNTEVIRRLLGESALAPGEIGRQMDILMSGASGGIMIMMAQIDTLLNRLAELGVLKAIQNFTKAVSVLIGWLTKTNEEGDLVNRRWLQMIHIVATALASLLAVAVALKVTTFALSGFVLLVKAARGVVWLWRNALILTRIQMGLLSVQTWGANSAISTFAATIWASTIGALRALGRRLAMASLAMLRFAGRAIVAGISGVIAFGAAIWASLIPPLIAATAAVVGFTVALLANPIVLLITGIIGAFVALGFVVYKFRRQIVDALMGVWNFVKDKWREIAGLLLLPILGPFALIATNAFGLRDKLIDAFTKVRDFFMGIWGTIVGIFRDHWVKILAVIFPAVGLPILIAQEWDQIVGIVGGIWNRVYETVKGWIEAIISFIKEIPGKVKDAVKDIPNMVTEAVKEIPVVGTVLNAAGGVADKAKGFLGGIGKALGLAEGGIIPGPLGRPLLATVHGGEMVLPVGASRVIAQMLEGFRLGPAALPQAPYHYGQMYRSSVTNRTVNININEPIVIQTQATDAKGIAQELHEAIEDKIRNIAYDHDGPVER